MGAGRTGDHRHPGVQSRFVRFRIRSAFATIRSYFERLRRCRFSCCFALALRWPRATVRHRVVPRLLLRVGCGLARATRTCASGSVLAACCGGQPSSSPPRSHRSRVPGAGKPPGRRVASGDARAARSSRARADRRPRPGSVARRARGAGRADLARGARLALRTGRPTTDRARPLPGDARAFFGDHGGPAPAPTTGSTIEDVLAEFRERLAPHAYAAQHPGSYSYFTPPPLPVAVAGETLARWLNQGIDVWLAGMAAPFVEEEVVRWLCDLVGYGDDAWGVLTSGGVMANVMAVAIARDAHLGRSSARRIRRAARGSTASARTRRIRRTSRSSAGSTSRASRRARSASFPRTTTSDCAPTPSRTRSPRIARTGLRPFAIFAVVGSTNTGAIDDVPGLADLAARGPLAARRRRLRRGGPDLRRGRRTSSPPWSARTRSRSIRTSGCSSRTTSAACSCAGGSRSSARSTASPSTTRSGDRRSGRSTGTSTRSRARGRSAR